MPKRSLALYNVTWKGFGDATRQALPSRLVAKNRAEALQLLAETLAEAQITDMPDSITVTWVENESESGHPRVIAWLTVGN